MSYRLKTEYADRYDMTFIFANTGQENEATLQFVDACDWFFGLNVVWVEALVSPRHGVGVAHKVVNFASASRNGEPFEAFIAKSGIPNANKPQCSDRLKLFPIESYKDSVGLKGAKHAIGIRADEARRRSSKPETYNLVYPLLDWFPSDKQDVNDFWESQPFNLQLKEYEGNCKTCWKKTDRKLFLVAKDDPTKFDFCDRMERTHQHVKPNANGERRVFFRKNRSTQDMLAAAALHDEATLRRLVEGVDPDDSGGCTESCEAYGSEPPTVDELFR